MSSQSEEMHCYEQIALLTERMLIPARAGQWGALPALEARCSDMVDRLKAIAIEPLKMLDESQSVRKYQLLGRINSNLAEIRGIVMPQMVRLGAVLKSLELQQRLQKTYHQAANDAML